MELQTAALGVLMAVDEYVEGLPKIRRALVAGALLVAGGFGGGVAVTLFGIRDDLNVINIDQAAMAEYIVQDQAAMVDMRSSLASVRDAINDLICELNNIPLDVRCEIWISSGRPEQ
jgi:hypothetical protein